MSVTSSEFSVVESEGVPDLYGSRRDTFSIESECFNRLDVFNLGTINAYGEIDDGNKYICLEEFSLSSGSSEDETEASLVSFDSYSDEGSFVSRHDTKMCCGCMLMHDRGSEDSLGWLSISSMSSCESQIGHSPPICNVCLNPINTSSNSVEAAWSSDSMDVHSDKEASSIESTSIGVSPVDSVDNSADHNHVSLRKRVKNGICSFFKRAWNAIKYPSLCCETRVEPFVPPPDDTETDSDDSSCSEEPSCFKSTDESDESGYEIGTFASGGFSSMSEETSSSNGIWTSDVDCLDEDSLSSDTSEDGCGVIACGPFSIQRRNPVRRLGEWSFDSASNHFIGEGGRDSSLDLLSISSGISSTEERSGAWQNGPARETCACSDCVNMYTTGSSTSLEEPSDEEAPSVGTVENSTEKRTSLRKKMKKGISSFFKKAWKPLKWPSFCCCHETRVVPLHKDSETDPEPDDHNPHFVCPLVSSQLMFDHEMVMIGSGSFGFLGNDSLKPTTSESESSDQPSSARLKAAYAYSQSGAKFLVVFSS